MSTSTSTSAATRTVDGVELPVAGTWAIDPSHSTVGFVVRHLMVGRTRGRFGAFDGVVTVAEDPTASSVEVTIDAASIDTRDETRDGHLRSPDFFDVERHPSLTFESTGVVPVGAGRWSVTGTLTIRGEARPVTLDVEYEGTEVDPWGNQRAAFTARTEVDREAWGLTWNQALETGGVLVGKKARIELEVEAVLQQG
ncbi:MAG: YceI family protein [Acidimicrobiales bacterium]|nr:YceI family protein [Acidimicrobiales bacterium]